MDFYLPAIHYHQYNTNIILENESKVSFDTLVHKYNQIISDDLNGKTCYNFINSSLKIFGIEHQLDIKLYEEYIATISLTKNNKSTPLIDFGFGYTQVLALILFLAREYDGESLGYTIPLAIIEEPETNLHPNLQSKIADLFNLYFQSFYDGKKHNFIIETHSEYLIRKFQYLVAKGEMKSEDIIIYYFNDDKYVSNEETKVKSIEITKNGNLTDTFGPGFYDEVTKLQFDLLKINKEQNN